MLKEIKASLHYYIVRLDLSVQEGTHEKSYNYIHNFQTTRIIRQKTQNKSGSLTCKDINASLGLVVDEVIDYHESGAPDHPRAGHSNHERPAGSGIFFPILFFSRSKQ